MRVYCVETNICEPFIQYFRSHVAARKNAVQIIRDFVQEERKYNKSFRLAEVAYDLSIQIKACTVAKADKQTIVTLLNKDALTMEEQVVEEWNPQDKWTKNNKQGGN